MKGIAGGVKLPGLQHQRELRFWTVADLARHAGCSWATVALADVGQEVSPGTARKILLALEAVSPSPTAIALLGERCGVQGVEGGPVSVAIGGPTERSRRPAA